MRSPHYPSRLTPRQGLSTKAIRWQTVGHVPSATGYSAFVGAFAVLVGLIGLAVIFLTKLEKPMVITDALAAALLFAGGVAYAVQLRGVDCSDGSKGSTTANELINGGCRTSKEYGGTRCAFENYKELEGRCKTAEANAAFMFLSSLVAMTAIVLGVLAVRKAGRRYGASGA